MVAVARVRRGLHCLDWSRSDLERHSGVQSTGIEKRRHYVGLDGGDYDYKYIVMPMRI